MSAQSQTVERLQDTVAVDRPTMVERINSTQLDLAPHKKGGTLSALGDSMVIAKRGLIRIPRQLDWLIGVTVMPIMFLLMFRYIFGGTVQATLPQGASAVNYLVGGILVQGLVFSGLNTALGLATDAKEGLMDRFRSLPMAHGAVLFGRVLTDMAIAVFTTTITILVGLLVGFRPDASPGNWLAAIGLMLLTAFTFSWLGAVIGMWLKTVEAVNSIGFSLVMPLTFISSAFANPDYFPSWMQGFAKNQPFTLSADAIRSLLTGYPELGNKGWLAAAWYIGSLVITIPLSVWLFERRNKA